MPLPLIALTVASQLTLVADGVPTFDINQSCRAAASTGVSPDRNAESCRRDEQSAREELAKAWSGYSAAERARCTSLVRLGGAPSYVELLTCLDMAKSAAELPDEAKMKQRNPR